jgi:uncharacterized membrane protein YkgB
MAQTIRPQRVISLLNTDGKAHPRENSFVAAAAVLGAVSVITSIFASLHLLTSWTGLVGILTAAYGQFISATTSERFFLVLALGASGIGFFIGVAHGGLWGGL